MQFSFAKLQNDGKYRVNLTLFMEKRQGVGGSGRAFIRAGTFIRINMVLYKAETLIHRIFLNKMYLCQFKDRRIHYQKAQFANLSLYQ